MPPWRLPSRWLATRDASRRRIAPGAISVAAIWVGVAALVGARSLYVAQNELGALAEDPVHLIMAWDGGLSFYGALLGALLALIIFARRRRMASLDGDARRSDPAATNPAQSRPTRPRWLLPGLAAAFVAAGLVVAGVVSLTTMFYLVAFGGMLLLHLGGHGHGGHGGHAGHGGHGSPATSDDQDLSGGSDASQPSRSALGGELDDRAPNQNRSETHDDDEHSSHGCH